MNDLIAANQQIQEELHNNKIKEEKIITEKNLVEDELAKMRMIIEDESIRREELEEKYK